MITTAVTVPQVTFVTASATGTAAAGGVGLVPWGAAATATGVSEGSGAGSGSGSGSSPASESGAGAGAGAAPAPVSTAAGQTFAPASSTTGVAPAQFTGAAVRNGFSSFTFGVTVAAGVLGAFALMA